ncbi:GumC family protein [Oleisolibacter albus]|uniref:GumC family protein n=1 Tax=Oleisolibacter albus TaxID=2171757 RepID=UPI000DF23BE8|nr:polysaccharide biosynthesis tyrosine autokinase [Oleisolibacter albus]
MTQQTSSPAARLAPVTVVRGQDGGPRAAAGDTLDFDLSGLLRIFRRRLGWFIGTLLLLGTVGLVAVLNLTPTYMADAVVFIESRRPKLLDVEELVQGISSTAESIQSEVEILKSREMALKVVNKLNLVDHPLFNTPTRAMSVCNAVGGMLGAGGRDGLFSALGMADYCVFPDDRQAKALAIASGIAQTLTATQIARSYTILLAYESTDPQLSADIVNTVADLYLVDQYEAKYQAAQRATTWLEERIGELRSQVVSAEQAVESFRAQSGMVAGKDDTTILQQQISESNANLSQARAQLADARARLNEAQAAAGTGSRNISALQAIASPLLSELIGKEAELQRRMADLSQSLGDRHPQMVALKAELEGATAQVNAEISRRLAGLRSEVNSAQARVNSLQGNLSAVERRAGDISGDLVKLRELEREATASRTLLETFLARSKEIGEQHQMMEADARIISRALVPADPAGASKKLLFLGILVVATVAGLAVVGIVEKLDNGFRDVRQVENTTGTPVIALVPDLRKVVKGDKAVANYIIQKPLSQAAEAVNALRSQIWLSTRGGRTRTVALTSSLANEGKTTLTIWLARMCAMHGERVLLIDCDFRNPNVHKSLGGENKVGVVDLLLGRAEIGETVQTDASTGLSYIAAGRGAFDGSAQLRTPNFGRLLMQLSQSYDLVLIDCPPVMALSDSKILAAAADQTVFVCRWRTTNRKTAIRSLEELRNAGVHVMGVMLSVVDVERNALFTDYYTGAYLKGTNKYYAD